MTATHCHPVTGAERPVTRRSGIHRPSPAALRAAAVPAIATGLALSLTACLQLPLGGGGAPATAGGGAVDFDGVQSATIQIEAVGTFVDPSEGGYEAAGRGSGFLIDESGIAVTNNHVVTGAGTIKVWRGGDTSEQIGAKVLGVSECLDLAVIQLEGDDYPYMEWHKGEITTATDVYAAGFPLGDPDFTMTRGIVSKESTDGQTPWASIDSVIEHDARIRGGNSGGPLVDAKGKLMGVNYAGWDAYDYNYAIHRDEVLDAVKQLRKGEDVLSLGVNGTALRDDEGNGLGIWVNSVKSGSSADEAGIQPGDLLTRMEGVSLGLGGTMTEYCDVLRTHGDDATLSIELYRPSEEAYFRGKINGDEEIEMVSLAGEASGGKTGGSNGGKGTVEDYTVVTDDSGVISAEVPSNWDEVDGSSFTDDAGNPFYGVMASPDLAGFQNDWNTPGVAIYASSTAVSADAPQVLIDAMTSSMSADGCVQASADAFEDGMHTGLFSYWTGCGGTETAAIAVAANSNDGKYVILVTMQVITEADLVAVDRVLGTFSAQF